jgi:Ca-activated chloride channel family protein
VTLSFARLWMLGLGVALVVALLALAIATRKRGLLRAGGLVVALLGAAPLVYEGLIVAGVVRETYVRFHHPQALVFVAALAIFVGLRLSRLPHRLGRTRRWAIVSLSALSALAAGLVVAEPEIGKPLDRLAVVVAVDRSRSIDLVPGADARLRTELQVAEKSMHDDDRIGTIVFGATAAVEDPLRPRTEPGSAQRVEVGRDATDIEAAVRRAIAEVPADAVGRIVLVTDGVQTRGDALAAAAAAVAADVQVDTVVLDQKVVPDVRVVSVRAPSRVDESEPFELRVVTASAVGADVELRIRRDDGEVRSLKAHIESGEDVLRLRELGVDPGLHRYDVAVTALDPAADAAPEDNTGSAFVRVRGAALALVLEGDAGHGAPIRKALEASGFHTVERAAMGVPNDIGGFAPYDLVVLSDIRASELATTQIDALAAYTRDLGGGLMLMGGDRSMGPGGYARTPIEEVSPVAFDLKQEKRRASLAEVIAIDYSGSMGAVVSGHTKLELANEAAARSASLLGEGDRLGVEHVDTVVRWTVPMAPVKDPRAIAEAIRKVGVGGGGIYTDIALRAGYEALSKEAVNLKHLLLFADGSDAEQIAGCRAIVKEGFDHGMTTSVISLGRGSDSPELEALSKIGGGRFYLIEDATKLPAVFSQETILAARSSIHETPFKVSVGVPAAPTRGIDFAKQPFLQGYVVTMPKPRASLLLGGPEDDPLLATWSVGIGRTAAFTSDYKDRWGEKWLGWPDGAKLFGQLGRDIGRKADDPRVRLEADASGGELHVRADVVGDDGRAQTFRRLTIHVAGPDGYGRDLPLEAVGAGRYAATLPLSRAGTYVATAKDEVSGDPVGTIGAVLTAGEELRPTPSDRVLLARIASMTGGKARDTLAGLFDDRAAKRFAYKSIVPALLLTAALAMLLAVAARRVGVPNVVGAMATRVRVWRDDSSRRRAARAAEAARVQAMAIEDQQRLRDAIVARRKHDTTPLGDAPQAGIAYRPTAQHQPAPAPAALPIAPFAAPTPEPPPPNAPPPPPTAAQRPLTAAERLALKRRERR